MALMSRATHVLQWPVQTVANSRGEANPKKTGLSTDKSLQLDSLKSESLVIPDQQAGVNTFPGLVHTARHTMGVDCSRSGYANPQGRQAPKEWLVTGVKS